MSGPAEKLHGVGLGLKAVLGFLLRDDAPAPAPAAPAGGTPAQAAPTVRLCRKPQAPGWHCYERDNHPGVCNLEPDGAP